MRSTYHLVILSEGALCAHYASATPFAALNVGDGFEHGSELMKIAAIYHTVEEGAEGVRHGTALRLVRFETSISADDNPVPWPWLARAAA